MARLVTSDQLEYLITFLEENKSLALGHYNRSTEGREKTKRLWRVLAENMKSISVNGAEKDDKGWRMFFNDYKCKTLKKIKLLKSEQTATGGGKKKKIELTPCEDRLYSILGRDVAEPISGVRHNPLAPTAEDAEAWEMPVYLHDQLEASAMFDAIERGDISPQAEQSTIEVQVGDTNRQRPQTPSPNERQPSPRPASTTRPRRSSSVTQSRRRRRRQDENEPSSQTALCRAQDAFVRSEEASTSSRLVLADAINNMAAAYRERTERRYGGEMSRRRARIIEESDSD